MSALSDVVPLTTLLTKFINQIYPATGVSYQNIAVGFDTSGSTGNNFDNKNTILQKEQEVVHDFIIENSSANIIIFSFSDKSMNHGEYRKMDTIFSLSGEVINLDRNDGYFIDLPAVTSGGMTNTIEPLNDIKKSIEKSIEKNECTYDLVVIITDGQTNSTKEEIVEVFQYFTSKGIDIHIVAVSNSNQNLETISSREEINLAGMDLVNYGQNYVSKLIIFNKYHCDVPFIGAERSSQNKKSLQFLGSPIPPGMPVPAFLSDLIEIISDNASNLSWGINQIESKKFCVEIGKIWQVMYVQLSITNRYLNTIIQKLSSIPNFLTVNGAELISHKIFEYIQYGFDCSSKNIPVRLTGLEEHVKAATVKKQEFAVAVKLLEDFGPIFRAEEIVSLPFNGLCCTILANP
jgi:hypothetical protein